MRALVSLVTLGLIGCATPYQPGGTWSVRGGYVSEQLGPDRFSVKADGNGYTSQQRIEDIVMMRAAVIALENGAEGFVFESNEAHAERGTAVGVGAGVVMTAPVVRPDQSSVIRLIHAPVPPDLGAAYHDAREVEASVGRRLGVHPTSDHPH